jgi:hypothetical protein
MNITERWSKTPFAPAEAQARWSAAVDELRERKAARLAHRTLERELSTYSTQSEVTDLLAALDGVDSDDSAEIRSILQRNLRDHSHRISAAS